MPRDFLAEAVGRLDESVKLQLPLTLTPQRATALRRRLAYLERDNAVLRAQHETWHHYATTDMTAAQMDARLREIENETHQDIDND